MSSICSQKLMAGEVDSRSMCINLTDTLFMEEEETYDIVMSSLCSVEVTSNLDKVISDAGYEVMLDNVSINLTDTRERIGSVVEYLTRNRRASDSSVTGVTALCP